MERYNWNPWHGCHKKSPGCLHCFVFSQDAFYQKDSNIVRRVKTNFNLPLKRNRHKEYRIPSGSAIATCFTSDFFIEEADEWRAEVWQMIAERSDCKFFIITKRPERIKQCLPPDWGDGYDNVLLNVTTENQKMADERIPFLLDIPLKFRGVVVAPILEAVNLRSYLATGLITAVSVGGESYSQARQTNFDDILFVRQQCLDYRVNFSFHQTGSNFVKDGVRYRLAHHQEYEQAAKAGLGLSF